MKTFDMRPHKQLIDTLNQTPSTRDFESACEPIVLDILEHHEGFTGIQSGPRHVGTPFDYFGWRNGKPYIVEFKGSRHHWNFPGKTQQRRLADLLSVVRGIHAALLQVRVCEGRYRVLYDDQFTKLLMGREAPLEPIAAWLRERIDKR